MFINLKIFLVNPIPQKRSFHNEVHDLKHELLLRSIFQKTVYPYKTIFIKRYHLHILSHKLKFKYYITYKHK